MIDVYYIEDDETIADSVREYLQNKGYRVTTFSTIGAARRALSERVPGIVLVDWNMPDGRGDGLCREIRAKWRELPVIFLTVRGDTRDIVSGFKDGADDYVVKPFELEVLSSRMEALLRRAGNAADLCLSCGPISLDRGRMAVCVGGEEVALSQPEYRLLLLLMENKGRTLTRERLLEQIWDSSGNYVNDNTLTVTMKRLREKLRQPACIKTVRSFGYRMEDGE